NPHTASASGYATTSSAEGANGRCVARAATVSATAAPTHVATRRHWYCTGYTCCAYAVMPKKSTTYDAAVEIDAPTKPYAGMSQKFRPTLTAAPIPVTTQLSCVLRARPLPIASTV